VHELRQGGAAAERFAAARGGAGGHGSPVLRVGLHVWVAGRAGPCNHQVPVLLPYCVFSGRALPPPTHPLPAPALPTLCAPRSGDCEGWYARKSNGSACRRALFALERGVCVLCRLDCHALVKRLQAVEKGTRGWEAARRRIVAQHWPRLLVRPPPAKTPGPSATAAAPCASRHHPTHPESWMPPRPPPTRAPPPGPRLRRLPGPADQASGAGACLAGRPRCAGVQGGWRACMLLFLVWGGWRTCACPVSGCKQRCCCCRHCLLLLFSR
jgi:hypothetical protein